MGAPDECPTCGHDWCICRKVEAPPPPSRRITREVDMSDIQRRMMDTVRPPSLGE